ncbi:hypothetical protein Cni_G04171 [Canna indica]|uniref:Uncharacterized protein n=1 Tax=Canna indica TaxID=4628 RepID=A0AAQ3JSH4_9LILI|nr:hypothetical protein Cni_G04171 [Canna indica]
MVKAPVIVPLLQLAVYVCLAISVMLFVEKVYMAVVITGVRFLGRRPEKRYKWEPMGQGRRRAWHLRLPHGAHPNPHVQRERGVCAIFCKHDKRQFRASLPSEKDESNYSSSGVLASDKSLSIEGFLLYVRSSMVPLLFGNFDDIDMDLTTFKLDIDELLEEYTEGNYNTLADMKSVWMIKKFSYIFEAKPTSKEALFMQSLYSFAIRHMVSKGELSRRLGGLYCLYCLYESQPYYPSFKIYLSLGELKSLKMLVLDAKKMGIAVVPALVKRMLDKNTFLFGSVDVDVGNVNQKIDEVMKIESKRLQGAHEALFGNTSIDDYLHMDLGIELELDRLKNLSKEYAEAKELAISEEAHDLVGGEDVKLLMDDNTLIGDKVHDIVKEWDVQKETFYKQTGISHGKELVVADDFDEVMHLLNE